MIRQSRQKAGNGSSRSRVSRNDCLHPAGAGRGANLEPGNPDIRRGNPHHGVQCSTDVGGIDHPGEEQDRRFPGALGFDEWRRGASRTG